MRPSIPSMESRRSRKGNSKTRTLLALLIAGLLAVTLAPLLAFKASASGYPSAYVISGALTGGGQFGVVNLTSGTYQPMGPVEPDGYFGLAQGPNGSLFAMTYAGNLDSIDPTTGVFTSIGATGLTSCVYPGQATCGPESAFSLGGFEGKIYATDFNNDIYTIDPKTAEATLLSQAPASGLPSFSFILGSQNNDADGTLNFADEAIWQSGEKLYMTYDAWVFDPVTFSVASVVVPPALYEIDPTTGMATEIGSTQLGIGGVAEVNGVNYAFDDLTNQVLVIHLNDGKTAPVGSFNPAAGVIQGAVSHLLGPLR